jgi:hypothetical protein
MQKDRTYVGNGKEVNGYDLVNFSICLSDIPEQAIFTGKNGKKYANFTQGKRKEVNEYGHTHSVWLNDFKPEAQASAAPAPSKYKSLENDPLF